MTSVPKHWFKENRFCNNLEPVFRNTVGTYLYCCTCVQGMRDLSIKQIFDSQKTIFGRT